MAQQPLFHRAAPTEEQRRRDDQQHRRKLRIAIWQLERAELYLVALYSLDMASEGLEERVDDLIRDLRGLRQDLVRLKAVT